VSRPALGPTQPPVQWVPGVLSLGVKCGRGVTLTTHPHLLPRSWVSRSYTSLCASIGMLWDALPTSTPSEEPTVGVMRARTMYDSTVEWSSSQTDIVGKPFNRCRDNSKSSPQETAVYLCRMKKGKEFLNIFQNNILIQVDQLLTVRRLFTWNFIYIYCGAGPSGRAVWSVGWSLGRWNRGFESCLRHRCLPSCIHYHHSLITVSSTLYAVV
jgi:hypothetical protein